MREEQNNGYLCVRVWVEKGVETTYSTCNIRLLLVGSMISLDNALAQQENTGGLKTHLHPELHDSFNQHAFQSAIFGNNGSVAHERVDIWVGYFAEANLQVVLRGRSHHSDWR